jgi:DNA-binding transcriptional ArsR family regulator
MPEMNSPDPLPALTTDQTEMLAELFHLLGERSRLGIVLVCLESPMPVGEIAASLGLSPSLVSHHLRLLRAARLLRGERRGKQVFYTAADEHVRTVVTDLANHILEPGHSSEE